MSGFGGTIKLTGEEQYRAALKNIATSLQQVSAQQKLTAATYEKSDTSLSALSQRSKDLTDKLAAQKDKLATITEQLKKWRTEQESAKSTIQNLQSQLEKEKAKLEAIEKQYGKNSNEYKAQAKVVDDLEKQLAELNTEYDKNEQTIKKNEAAQTSAQAAVLKTEKELGKLADQAKKTADDTEDLGDETENAGKKAKSAGDGFTVFKGILANLATDVIRRVSDGLKTMAKNMVSAGIDFDSAMSKVEAVSGATGEELDKLTAKAQEMGKKTKFSATESAEAFNYMAMAGWKTEDMLSGIEGVMNLAAASGSDLATTSDIVTDALTAMGYSAGDAGRLADVMAAASSNANTNVEMMGETFKYAASVAGSLGYSMEDIAIATGLMANSGIKASQAGTALRSIMQRIATDTGGAATAMREMGVETTNADGTMRPLSDVMNDLRKAMANMTDEQKTATAKTIAGTEAMGGLLAIVNAAPADYEKLTKAVKDSSGAAQKMADTMNDNVGGKLTLLKSQLEGIYLTIWKKVEPSISKAIDTISKALSKVNWEDFGKKAGAALEKLAQGFEWIVENRGLVIGALTAITGAFAVKKVADFGAGLIETASTLASIVKPASAAAGALSGASGAMATVGTGAASAAGSTGLLATAFGALTSPVGLAVVGITALVGVVLATGNAFKTSTSEIEKNSKATNNLAKEQKDFTESLKETKKAREDNVASANKELENTDALIYRLDQLSSKEEKTAKDKKEIQAIVEELNRLVPDLALSYDAEADSLSENTSKIEANIEARKNLNLAEKERENLSGITNDMTEAEDKLAKAVEQNEKNEKTYLEAKKKREEFENKYTPQQIANNIALQNELIRLTQKEELAQRTYEKGKKTVSEYGKTISDLKGDYEETARAAEDFERRANVAVALEELAAKAKEAGREIPKQLAEGMDEGRYAVPKSIEELDKLINFDKAIQEAGLAGVKIPESISAGLMEGKYSVEEAMAQVNEIVDLANKAEQMYNDGANISKNLADGIRSGKVSVEEANAEIEASLQFENLVQQALTTGIAIPNNLGEGIREGTITAQEAVQQMKDSITFDELTQKATQAGIDVPTFLADQITAGEIKPKEAVDRMQALIDYQKALDDAGLAGVTIPEEFTNGILSGEYSVTDTIATMNGWVQFKKALADTDLAGKEIPKQLAANILAGKTSPENAVRQMNNWVKFQDAIKTTKAAGKEVPQDLADAILSGKLKPETAVKMLNKLMQDEALKAKKGGEEGGKAFDDGLYSGLNNGGKKSAITNSISALGGSMKSTLQSSIDAHSPSRDAARIGGYFLDGVYNGVANQSKRSSIFNSLWNFGNGLLNKLKASLQEHSPSKATEEMGANLLKGIVVGVDDEEDNVLSRVKELGESMLGTLDDSLADGISEDTFSNLQNAVPSDFSANIGQTTARLATDAQSANTNVVEQLKQALGEMKIVMDDEEMGRFVDKTVTDLVYN